MICRFFGLFKSSTLPNPVILSSPTSPTTNLAQQAQNQIRTMSSANGQAPDYATFASVSVWSVLISQSPSEVEIGMEIGMEMASMF